MDHLEPEHPRDAGVPEQIPDVMQFEGAELLANEARAQLRNDGFTDREIDEWAQTYIVIEHSGDVESFLVWIRNQEKSREA
jgi:hypothetical protein